MKAWTEDLLIDAGYKIENAQIKSITLNMRDHACLVFMLCVQGSGWGVNLGGYKLGTGYLGAEEEEFEGSAAGTECIMRVMDTVGVEDIMDLKGKYIRVALKGWGDAVKIFGNILQDKWFDYESFFSDKQKAGERERVTK